MSELGSEAKGILDAARQELEPSTEDRARVRARIAARVGAGLAAGAAVTAATKTLAASTSVAPGAAAATGVASSAAIGASAAGVGAGASGALGAGAGAAGLGLVGKLATGVALFAAVGVGGVTYTKTKSSPPASVTASASPAVSASRGAGAKRAPTLRADRVVMGGDGPEPAAEQSPAVGGEGDTPLEGSSAERTEQAPARNPVPAGAASANPLRAEIDLLKAANRALHADEPARALALYDEHLRRFPGGTLSEERQAGRVLALCALRRFEQGLEARSRFLREYPASPHAGSVREACAERRNERP